ncbi:glutamine-hydrolyzing GMP synthase [Tanacetum coccineum]
MARKTPKCPPMVEANQFGCKWNFSGIFDHNHHHDRPQRKMLSNESHGSKNLQAGNARSQVRMLTFDEQLRSINTESKMKTANMNQSVEGETSSSNRTRQNDEVLKNTNTMDLSFWKKIKSRYENPNKKKENTMFVDRIVILKPSHHVVECPVDIGCRCSYLHHHQSSLSKQQLIKHTHISFNDVRKKLKNAKKMKNSRKIKSFEASESGEINEIDSKMEKLSIVPFSKKQEPEVFTEAKRHLAERLRQIGKGVGEPPGSSSKRESRTLERILLFSPVHESMATFHCEPNNMLDVDLETNNIISMEADGSTEGSRMKFSMDVSSPKVDCKLGNMDNDQFRENPSPVSVLDFFFTDNISSPTSTSESAELQIQPHRLDFEENSSQTSSSPRKTNLSSVVLDREFIFSYVNDIYQMSQSNWEDFLAAEYPTESSCEHKLLHDCVKEVLVSLQSRFIFFSSNVRPFSLERDVVNEVIDQVDWHNGQPVGPRTLDLLVKRDIAKCGQWVDVISDRNDIVFEIVDETLQELIMETIFDIHISSCDFWDDLLD